MQEMRGLRQLVAQPMVSGVSAQTERNEDNYITDSRILNILSLNPVIQVQAIHCYKVVRLQINY